jgi:Raf kinase inhibitor-like YbhB/YbcL family protein
MPFTLSSPSFSSGGSIPRRFTCDGDDVSPPFVWTDAPTGTQSFALIFDDPDASSGGWVHWVLYDLPAPTRALAETTRPAPRPEAGGIHGMNSWGRSDYGGPCPPSGTHRYFFRLYALDAPLGLSPGATADQLRKAMEGHILGLAELMGTYRR